MQHQECTRPSSSAPAARSDGEGPSHGVHDRLVRMKRLRLDASRFHSRGTMEYVPSPDKQSNA
ncbi:hypothetical protein EYF80_019537 [Liparis tanakae]|uniref:Uncharacterized protein n=1 Tax=Liparis tanakae TaxID=230148 RepID=A0A4Z2HZC9_9TELE|nr:hypothetical protein EYF80_019537 [Liparis tanakae]